MTDKQKPNFSKVEKSDEEDEDSLIINEDLFEQKEPEETEEDPVIHNEGQENEYSLVNNSPKNTLKEKISLSDNKNKSKSKSKDKQNKDRNIKAKSKLLPPISESKPTNKLKGETKITKLTDQYVSRLYNSNNNSNNINNFSYNKRFVNNINYNNNISTNNIKDKNNSVIDGMTKLENLYFIQDISANTSEDKNEKATNNINSINNFMNRLNNYQKKNPLQENANKNKDKENKDTKDNKYNLKKRLKSRSKSNNKITNKIGIKGIENDIKDENQKLLNNTQQCQYINKVSDPEPLNEENKNEKKDQNEKNEKNKNEKNNNLPSVNQTEKKNNQISNINLKNQKNKKSPIKQLDFSGNKKNNNNKNINNNMKTTGHNLSNHKSDLNINKKRKISASNNSQKAKINNTKEKDKEKDKEKKPNVATAPATQNKDKDKHVFLPRKDKDKDKNKKTDKPDIKEKLIDKFNKSKNLIKDEKIRSKSPENKRYNMNTKDNKDNKDNKDKGINTSTNNKIKHQLINHGKCQSHAGLFEAINNRMKNEKEKPTKSLAPVNSTNSTRRNTESTSESSRALLINKINNQFDEIISKKENEELFFGENKNLFFVSFCDILFELGFVHIKQSEIEDISTIDNHLNELYTQPYTNKSLVTKELLVNEQYLLIAAWNTILNNFQLASKIKELPKENDEITINQLKLFILIITGLYLGTTDENNNNSNNNFNNSNNNSNENRNSKRIITRNCIYNNSNSNKSFSPCHKTEKKIDNIYSSPNNNYSSNNNINNSNNRNNKSRLLTEDSNSKCKTESAILSNKRNNSYNNINEHFIKKLIGDNKNITAKNILKIRNYFNYFAELRRLNNLYQKDLKRINKTSDYLNNIDYTFHPKTNKNNIILLSKFSPQMDFFERSEIIKKRNDQKKSILQRACSQELLKECTFIPNSHKSSIANPQSTKNSKERRNQLYFKYRSAKDKSDNISNNNSINLTSQKINSRSISPPSPKNHTANKINNYSNSNNNNNSNNNSNNNNSINTNNNNSNFSKRERERLKEREKELEDERKNNTFAPDINKVLNRAMFNQSPLVNDDFLSKRLQKLRDNNFQKAINSYENNTRGVLSNKIKRNKRMLKNLIEGEKGSMRLDIEKKTNKDTFDKFKNPKFNGYPNMFYNFFPNNEPLFTVEIKIKQNIKTIEVYQGDIPEELTYKFCTENLLGKGSYEKILNIIKAKLNEINNCNDLYYYNNNNNLYNMSNMNNNMNNIINNNMNNNFQSPNNNEAMNANVNGNGNNENQNNIADNNINNNENQNILKNNNSSNSKNNHSSSKKESQKDHLIDNDNKGNINRRQINFDNIDHQEINLEDTKINDNNNENNNNIDKDNNLNNQNANIILDKNKEQQVKLNNEQKNPNGINNENQNKKMTPEININIANIAYSNEEEEKEKAILNNNNIDINNDNNINIDNNPQNNLSPYNNNDNDNIINNNKNLDIYQSNNDNLNEIAADENNNNNNENNEEFDINNNQNFIENNEQNNNINNNMNEVQNKYEMTQNHNEHPNIIIVENSEGKNKIGNNADENNMLIDSAQKSNEDLINIGNINFDECEKVNAYDSDKYNSNNIDFNDDNNS